MMTLTILIQFIGSRLSPLTKGGVSPPLQERPDRTTSLSISQVQFAIYLICRYLLRVVVTAIMCYHPTPSLSVLHPPSILHHLASPPFQSITKKPLHRFIPVAPLAHSTHAPLYIIAGCWV